MQESINYKLVKITHELRRIKHPNPKAREKEESLQYPLSMSDVISRDTDSDQK